LERDPETGEPLREPGDRRVELLQEFMGASVLGDGRFQKFLLMVGDGGNGKGVLQTVWTELLGRDNVANQGLDQFGSRFALQPLLGKLANICGDLAELDGVAEGILKQLTGGDRLTVDRKNLPAVSMAG